MFFVWLFILVYFLVFPLKIRIYLTNEKLQIYLYKFCVLDQELFQAMKEIQEVTIENIQNNLISKEDLIYINLTKKFDIKSLKIKLKGFNQNFEILSIFYGFFYFLLSSFDYYFYNKKIPFDYQIEYSQNSEFELDGIFKTNLGKILLEYFRLRRIKYGRTSN